MEKVVVYAMDNGGVAVVWPAPGWDASDVARKDAPAGAPYLIMDASDLPTDLTYRDAWTADFSSPHGYGIGPEAWFAERAAMAGAQEDIQ